MPPGSAFAVVGPRPARTDEGVKVTDTPAPGSAFRRTWPATLVVGSVVRTGVTWSWTTENSFEARWPCPPAYATS